MAVSDLRQPSSAREFLSFPGLMARKHAGSKVRPHAPLIRARIGQLLRQTGIEVWNISCTRSDARDTMRTVFLIFIWFNRCPDGRRNFNFLSPEMGRSLSPCNSICGSHLPGMKSRKRPNRWGNEGDS
jgi:hypothetical protein